MSVDRFEQAIAGIPGVFATPADIQQALDLAPAQKVEILRQWEQDLRQRMSASGEGMIARGSGRTAELLRQVKGALREIRSL